MLKAGLKNLALLAVTSAIALVIGEVAARVVFSDITTTADNRSYFAEKWKRATVRLNSLGYREREVERTKAPGTYRVAFIGDSYTFGQGILEEERMSNIVERRLKEAGAAVQVLNFGNAGNNTADELEVLRTIVRQGVAPDFVLLQWYVNDVEYKAPASGAPAPADAPPPSSPPLNDFRMWMRNSSVLYFLAGEVWHRILDRVGPTYADDIARQFTDPSSFVAKEADRALRDFFTTCRDHRIRVGVVLVPSLAPLGGKEYPFQYLHDRVIAACTRDGVVCIDLLDTYRPQLQDQKSAMGLWVNRFDPHMGTAANRLAADRLIEVFGREWAAGARSVSAAAAH